MITVRKVIKLGGLLFALSLVKTVLGGLLGLITLIT